MTIEKIDREELKNLLNDIFANSYSFRIIEGTNPCLISYNEVEYYIYQKNLSPAQLSNNNPDIWRIQLPIREIFDYIRESPKLFVLLGYDAENDIYTTWNPYWSKQRLNVAKSVSFYSRKQIQDQANKTQELLRQELNNGGEVIVFPRTRLPYYLQNIQGFFPEQTVYVALGSRKRTEANESYRQLTDMNNIAHFSNYLHLVNYSDNTISNYCRAIRKLINEGYFSRNRTIFLKHDSLSEYPKAIQPFFEVDEIKQVNFYWHNTYSSALIEYINFLMALNNEEELKEVGEQEDESKEQEYGSFNVPADNDSLPNNFDFEKSTMIGSEEPVDWEVIFTNEQGVLTRIANPELIDKLRPCLDEEYPSYPKAFNVIEDFYNDRYENNMQFKDWQKLFEEINWSDPYYQPNAVASDNRIEVKRKTHVLKVTYPDGRVIQNRMVADTLVEVISNSYPELITKLNIFIAGVNLVSKEYDFRYKKYQRNIQEGWLVMTNSSTDKKKEIIQKISDELDLGLLIEQIPIEELPYTQAPVRPYSVRPTSRSKIQVTLPTGGVIYNSKVLYTLLEVVNYAGPEKVRELNINICAGNLILLKDEINPQYETATKPVNEGWYVNTCSDTQTKCIQIQQISDKLGLNLKVELV